MHFVLVKLYFISWNVTYYKVISYKVLNKMIKISLATTIVSLEVQKKSVYEVFQTDECA